MSLTKIDLDILKHINNNIISINDLVQKYNITSRTIRYSLNNINYYLSKYDIDTINIKKSKIYLSIDDDKIITFFKSLNFNEYILSKEERIKFILLNFLFKKNIKITILEEKLNVSRTTIKNDIKELKSYLYTFEVYFNIDNNKLFLMGKEKKLRHLMFLKLSEYISFYENKIRYIEKITPSERRNLDLIKDYIYKQDLNNSIFVINNVENKLKYNFSDKFRNIIFIYLIVTFERISNNHILNRKNNYEFLMKIPEYSKIKEVLNNVINKDYEYEMLHLTEYFLSEYYHKYSYENKIIVERFIIKVLEDLNIKIRKDIIDKLMQYIIPAIYRIKNNFTIENNIDINKIEYDLLTKVQIAIDNNVEYLKEPLRDEEIYNIAKIIKNNSIQNKKISLKELLSIIEKYKDNRNHLAKKLIKRYSKYITDDLENNDNFDIIKTINKNNIFIINKDVEINKLLYNYLYSLYKKDKITIKEIKVLKNINNNFSQYFFISKNIFLLSTEYIKHHNIKKERKTSELHIIISNIGIDYKNEKSINIIFIILAKNKVEHLNILSFIINLIENPILLQKILHNRNKEEIYSQINTYINSQSVSKKSEI